MTPGEPENSFTIAVTPDDNGERLDRLVAAAPDIGSRAAAQKLIASGMVSVNGQERSKNYKVSEGEHVEVFLAPPEPFDLEPEDMDLDIPYEDENLLVVDKPAGIVTHPAKGHNTGTLVHGLLGRQIAGGEHPHRPGIVHRLDKDTSGLLIVARDEETHRHLTEALSRHKIERTYLCLVHGLFETREGTIEAPLGRDARERQQMAVTKKGGRDAVTHFRVLESWGGAPAAGVTAAADRAAVAAGKPGAGTTAALPRKGSAGYSLLEVRLETGRTHQIRVHLAAIGHPVAGDKVYGRRKDELGVGRQFLHSARLRFTHPDTGVTVDVSSPLPHDLQRVLEQLRGH
ncbi:MAG: RluA family pseudouridine synthase [Thermoleophilia bacterium]|nr:RluA family pseudouridine synthase [Thermoleophilia bacterium]